MAAITSAPKLLRHLGSSLVPVQARTNAGEVRGSGTREGTSGAQGGWGGGWASG